MEQHAGRPLKLKTETAGMAALLDEEGTEASPKLPRCSPTVMPPPLPITEEDAVEGGEGEGEGGGGKAEAAAGAAGSLEGTGAESGGGGLPARSLFGEGKFAPLPWEDYFEESTDVQIPGTNNTFHVYKSGSSGPLLLLLHGGGSSGLSFAVAAKKIQSLESKLRILAVDLRGHGRSSTADDSDLSTETLCADVAALVQAEFAGNPPAIIVVGHSMGGAIAIHLAASNKLPSLHGLVVVDVVEGTAMSSLSNMQTMLANRPASFPSIQKAIEWSVREGHSRNFEAARVAVPASLLLDPSSQRYVWRTPLAASERYWRGWYSGLSDLFLSSYVPKLLLLAGTDRLDRTLTIAQMQGRFQMIVVRHSGHAIQEDEPDEFSATVVHFIHRNRIGERGVEIPSWSGH